MKRLILFVFLMGCASRPVLYPNSKFKTVGKEVAQSDIDTCMEEADEYVSSSKGKNMAKGAGAGGLLGGAMGAVSGIFRGDVVGGAIQGAAIGGTGGAVGGALTPDEIRKRFVNTCLANKGYKIIGWD